MKAYLEPLTDSKYYGSQILVVLDDGSDAHINVWIMGNHPKPSERQAEAYREYLDNGDTLAELLHDNHFESSVCQNICEKIVKALNETP